MRRIGREGLKEQDKMRLLCPETSPKDVPVSQVNTLASWPDTIKVVFMVRFMGKSGRVRSRQE